MNFITPAYAQTIGQAPMELLFSLAPFGAILIVFYFLVIRPQQRRSRQHQEMLKNLRRGDVVVAGGGLIGKVTKVIDEREVEIEIAPDVKIKVVRHTIQDVRTKSEPVQK